MLHRLEQRNTRFNQSQNMPGTTSRVGVNYSPTVVPIQQPILTTAAAIPSSALAPTVGDHNTVALINALRSMNSELIKQEYEKLGTDHATLVECVSRLPHKPMIPYKHGQPRSIESTIFYCSWNTLADILADANNFEAGVYTSEWLWKKHGSNPNWIMRITKDFGRVQIINRSGKIVEELPLDNGRGPSALVYRLPIYSTTCYIEQINYAAQACSDCCTYIDEQLERPAIQRALGST